MYVLITGSKIQTDTYTCPRNLSVFVHETQESPGLTMHASLDYPTYHSTFINTFSESIWMIFPNFNNEEEQRERTFPSAITVEIHTQINVQSQALS